ncbi:uncharacterized protein LOC135400852 isoform X2 [Ornithodoros turicata]|uniref:uncharacterized protein LOC135400852 isoform X2 n=1 Tax=Ornithodoros turicata TaxID=34597 RepID=UPI0031387DCF
MHRRSSRKRRKSRYDESCSKVHHSAPNLPNRRGTQTLCTEPSLSHDKKCFDPVFEGETDLLERMASVEAGMSAELTTEEFQVMSRNVEQILSEARKTLAHHHDDRSVLAKPEGVKSTKGPSVLRDIEQKRKEVLPKTLQREGDKMKCIKQQKAKVLSLEDLEPAPEFPALSDTARARVVNSPYENFYSDLITGDDPLVVGLWRHLALQELSLDLNSLISQYAAEGDSGIQDMIVPQNVQDDDDYENSGVASTLPESTLQFTSGVPGTGAFDSLTSSPSNDSAEGIIMNESSSSA